MVFCDVIALIYLRPGADFTPQRPCCRLHQLILCQQLLNKYTVFYAFASLALRQEIVERLDPIFSPLEDQPAGNTVLLYSRGGMSASVSVSCTTTPGRRNGGKSGTKVVLLTRTCSGTRRMFASKRNTQVKSKRFVRSRNGSFEFIRVRGLCWGMYSGWGSDVSEFPPKHRFKVPRQGTAQRLTRSEKMEVPGTMLPLCL